MTDSLKKCKNCKHAKVSHTDVDDELGCTEVALYDAETDSYERCHCFDFIPVDPFWMTEEFVRETAFRLKVISEGFLPERDNFTTGTPASRIHADGMSKDFHYMSREVLKKFNLVPDILHLIESGRVAELDSYHERFEKEKP